MFKFGKRNQTHNDTGGTTAHHNNKGGLAKLAGGLPILLLALAAFVVALAGVSTVRHEVGENGGLPAYPNLDFTWFVVFFNLFVLLCCAIHLIGAGVGGRVMPIGTSAVVGLLAVATLLSIIETRDWDTVRKAVGDSTEAGKGATTLFAGFICLAILDGLLILILGNQHDTPRTVETKTYGNHPEGAFPTTTPVTHNTTGMAHATTAAAPHHDQGVNVV